MRHINNKNRKCTYIMLYQIDIKSVLHCMFDEIIIAVVQGGCEGGWYGVVWRGPGAKEAQLQNNLLAMLNAVPLNMKLMP